MSVSQTADDAAAVAAPPTATPLWYQRAVESPVARAILFFKLFATLTALYLLLELPHLGYNARLHWDAETALYRTETTPGRDELDTARGHIFDIVTIGQVTDPAAATVLFNAGDPRFTHRPLETVRLYYSQVSFAIARATYDHVGDWTGSPVEAVLAFQLTALLAMSFSLALLLTWAVVTSPPGRDFSRRIRLLFLATAAVVTCPIFLSLARQLLTETVGFCFLIPSMLLLVWALNPRRSVGMAVAATVVAAGGLVLTVRTRYSLGPAIALLVPMALLHAVPLQTIRLKSRHYACAVLAASATIAILVAVDYHFYGPLIFPWVYNDVMVRSTRLFFHDFPPYNMFFVMLYNNAAMVLLPTAAIAGFAWRRPVAGGSIFPRQQSWAGRFTIATLVVLLLLICQTARQQVGFQGRHLFALSGACTVVMVLNVSRVDWTRAGRRWFAGLCWVFLAFNLLSTFWMQRTDPLSDGHRLFAPSIVQRLRRSHPALGIALRGVAMYYEGADVARMHDGLITAEYLRQHQTDGVRSLLLTDPSPDDGQWWAGRFITRFNLADVRSMPARFDAGVVAPVRAALAAGRPVYLSTASRRAVCPMFQVEPVQTRGFDAAALYRVTRIQDAGYLTASSPYPITSADGIIIAPFRGVVRRFDINAWWVIAEISCEDISAFTDPVAVEFKIDGLHPGRRYEIGVVAWDPTKSGRKLTVVTDGGTPTTFSLPPEPAVENISTVPNSSTCRVRFTCADEKPANVCEIWIREIEK